MKAKEIVMPDFKSESEEADWWASVDGRKFLKQKTARVKGSRVKPLGSPMVAALNQNRSVQIALRLPEKDLAQARKIAASKGIGYQTLLKMLLHEGLKREAQVL